MNRALFNERRGGHRHHKPLAEGYRDIVPQFFRDRIRAFVDTCRSRNFVNTCCSCASTTPASRSRASTSIRRWGWPGCSTSRASMACRGRPGTSGRRSRCGAWTAGRTWYCRCSAVERSRCVRLRRRFLHDAAGASRPGRLRWWITVGTYAVSGIDLRAQHRDARPDQGTRARLLRAVPQPRPAASRRADTAARGLAEQPDDLADPGAPAE